MYIHDVIHLGTYSHPDAVQRLRLVAQSHPSDLKVSAAFLENGLVTAANYTSSQREYGKRGGLVVHRFVTRNS